MNRILKQHQGKEIHVVIDNLSTHKPKRDLWLARHPNCVRLTQRLAVCRSRQVAGEHRASQHRTYRNQKGEQMTARNFSISATAAAVFAWGVAFTPLVISSPGTAQSNPTMANVVPDGGEFAVEGKLQALDPGALTLTIAPETGSPMPMVVAPGVDLTNVSVGDVADVHFKRAVTFVVGSPHVPVGHIPVTSTVDEVARTPGGIGYDEAIVVGRVVKVNGPTASMSSMPMVAASIRSSRLTPRDRLPSHC
jgi:hypothetical protein